MANEIQRAMNILGSTLSGGALALAKGLSKGKKPSADKAEEKTETEDVISTLGFTTDLSSEEATQRAFSAANRAIEGAYYARMKRKNRLNNIAKRTKNEGKEIGGKK